MCGDDIDNLLTPVDLKSNKAMLLEYAGFHWPVSLKEGSGRSYRKRDVRRKAATYKEGHGYIFFDLTNDPIFGDRR